MSRILRYLNATRDAGFKGSVSLLRAGILGPVLPSRSCMRLTSRFAEHPMLCRPKTSDAKVFYQVFARMQYSCFDDLADVQFVMDCGANVGYASAYFLSRHRRARVLAVEPDQSNFDVLTRNLEPYGGRARAVRAGVWPRRCGLVVTPPSPGGEWAVEVREARPDESPQLQALDVESLMREAGCSRISILKVDIEGSERALFSGDCSWLDRVDNLAIEFHGAESEQVFMNALGDRRFELSRSTELTVCRRAQLVANHV